MVFTEPLYEMTPKQNLLRVLRNERPAWTPCCVHIANANNLPACLPQDLLKEPLDRLRVSEFVGGDILYETRGVRMNVPDGFSVETVRQRDSSESLLTTPQGRLTQRMRYSRNPSPPCPDMPPGHALPGPVVTSVHEKHYIAGLEGYKVLRAYFDAQSFEADEGRIAAEAGRVGDKGVVVLGGGPSSPLYALASSYAGIERLTYDLFDAPQEVEPAMEAMLAAACRWYEAAAATPCEVVRCTEDLDTKLVSPAMFRKYALPALKEYARICHAAGKSFVIHMCGHVRDFLPDVRDAGADAIHCLTPPPTGNTTVAKARSVLGGKTAAMLRVDPDLLLHGNGSQIDAAVGEVFKEAGDWRNLLMIIPCGRAPLGSIRRVIEQVHRLSGSTAPPSQD